MRSSVARLLVALLLGALPAAPAAAAPRVAVVKSSTLAPFERATKAITTTLGKSPAQPEVLTFDLEGEEANSAGVLDRVKRARADVIVTVGSLATASALADPGSGPVVFSMVLYPEQSGFLGGDRARVTGASLDISPDVQFGYVKRLLPTARRVGVLFHPAETGTVVETARGAATRQGLTLVAKPIAEHDDVVAAMQGLMADVDVVWAVADGHVLTPQATSALILASLRRRVPFIGLSTAHVRAGALAALYVDYDDVGEQTAGLALRVLQGESPGSLPVATPRRVGLAINLRTADHLGLELPADLTAEAGETVR